MTDRRPADDPVTSEVEASSHSIESQQQPEAPGNSSGVSPVVPIFCAHPDCRKPFADWTMGYFCIDMQSERFLFCSRLCLYKALPMMTTMIEDAVKEAM